MKSLKRQGTDTKKKGKWISAGEFDRLADSGEGVGEYLDWDRAIKRMTLDLPVWMMKALDAEAGRRGISRQAVIKNWLTEHLDAIRQKVSGRSTSS